MALRICRAMPAPSHFAFTVTFDPIVPDPKKKMAEVQQAGERLPRIPPYASILHALKCIKSSTFLFAVNPFVGNVKDLTVSGRTLKFFDLAGIGEDKFGQSSSAPIRL